MGKLIEKVFEVIALAIIFGFVTVFVIFFFQELFIKSSPDYISSGVGAFMGAFFAFLFLRLGDGLTRIYERQIKHYNALVELDFVLNKNRQEIATNLFIIGETRVSITKSQGTKSVIENPQSMKNISARHDLLLKIYGKDLINRIFSYFVSIDSLNEDLQTTEKFYRTVIEKTLISNDINIYLDSVPELEKHFNVLYKFLVNLMDKTNDVLARTRVGLGRKPLLTGLIFFAMRGYLKVDENQVAKEKKKIEAEVEKVKEESRIEIESILKN